MFHKQFSTLIFVFQVLVRLCAARAFSDEQVSLLPVSQKNPESIRKALKEAQIIPDTLDDFIPSCYLHILYSSSHKEVKLGDKIKPSSTKEAPAVRATCPYSKARKDINGFTVALTDPDAPSRENPEWSEMCHWIATLPSSAITWHRGEGQLDEENEGSREIVEYKPPKPPSKTGYHRYVFVLLEGDNTNLTAPSGREHWGTGKERHGVRDWAHQEGLEVVGANFFYAREGKQ